jgi:hypothetical protein
VLEGSTPAVERTLACAECGSESEPDAAGWRAYLDDDGRRGLLMQRKESGRVYVDKLAQAQGRRSEVPTDENRPVLLRQRALVCALAVARCGSLPQARFPSHALRRLSLPRRVSMRARRDRQLLIGLSPRAPRPGMFIHGWVIWQKWTLVPRRLGSFPMERERPDTGYVYQRLTPPGCANLLRSRLLATRPVSSKPQACGRQAPRVGLPPGFGEAIYLFPPYAQRSAEVPSPDLVE